MHRSRNSPVRLYCAAFCRFPKVSTTEALEAIEPLKDAPSIDVLYSEMQGRLAARVTLQYQLGEHARFVLTAASLLMAGFGALPGVPGLIASPLAESWFRVPSLVLYVYLAWAAFWGFRLRTFTSYPEPEGLRAYLGEDPIYTKRKLFATMALAHAEDQAELAKKTCWVERAQDALLALGGWLVFVLIVRFLAERG